MTDLQAAPSRTAGARAASPRSPLRKLYVQVLIAIVVGILLGHFYPSLGVEMKPISDGFIRLIRAVVPLIIFATVAVGIAKMGDMRRVGVVGLRAIIYFEVVSTLALFIGLIVGNLVQPGAGLHIDPAHLDERAVAGYVTSAKSLTIVDFLMKMIPTNLVGAVAQGEILPVLVMAVLFGFALCHLGERGQRLAGLIARLFGLRVWKIIRYFKDELLIAFSATSGEAMIPRSIAKLERMGCSEETVGLVLPTGFSFNTDGTAIYMTMAVLFIAQATDIHLTIGQQLTMLFVMLFTSKGAAGVAGAGFVALAATIPALGILPVGGLALLLGVERFMSEIRAVTNLFSNIFATVVVARWMGELDDERLNRVLDRDGGEPLDEAA